VVLKCGGVSLRLCNEHDAEFYRWCFEDRTFTNQFSRQRGWSGSLERALKLNGEKSPCDTGVLQWVVCNREQPVGLASLSSIDSKNSKAEFSIGLPQLPVPGVALKASLMAMHFAFFILGLNKLYTYVYEDNTKAQQNTIRIGFRKEGVLTDHFSVIDGGFVTVWAFGLTKQQALADENLIRKVERHINQRWISGRLRKHLLRNGNGITRRYRWIS
jgi:RimJ/RimL family protein N-acetyltransferase